jgi:putative ABC transport system ATP-binding protein
MRGIRAAPTVEVMPTDLTAAPPGHQILRATHLSRTFGTGPGAVHAVDGIDVDFGPASVTAIMGPSGSGKSTLMHLLAGLDQPTRGRVTLGAADLGTLSDDELTALRRLNMGFVFQSFNLFDELSVEENIDIPFTIAPDTGRPDVQWRNRLISELGLASLLRRRPVEISGGQQQRVAIARALAHKPAVLFADEPTGNLDLATGRDVLALISSLAPAQGCTVIIVTHDAVAASSADRVLVLTDGRVAHDLSATSAEDLSHIALAAVAL